MSITEINLGQLLKPISKDNPIGDDVERLDISGLRHMAEGTPKTQFSLYVAPNWRNVYRTSQKYLKLGKDLWAVHYLTTSAMELYEFDGLIKGLDLLKQMLEKYWDNIHPLLEPEDEDDFTMARLSPIATLCGHSEYLYPKLITMPLIKTKRLGTFSFEELKTLADEHGIRKKEHESVELNHIYSEVQGEYLDTLVAHFKKCLELFTGINDFINEKVGVEFNSGRVNLMIDLFTEMTTFFKENLAFSPEELEGAEDTNETENTESDSKGKTTTTKKRRGQLITNEKDVVKVFNEVCRWYEEYCPVSPVLTLTEYTRELIGKKYFESTKALDDMTTAINSALGVFHSSGSNHSTQSSAGATPKANTDSNNQNTKGLSLNDLGKSAPKTQVSGGKQKTMP